MVLILGIGIGILIEKFFGGPYDDESTNYSHVSADCPERAGHQHTTMVCPRCGYDPSLPEGERETI
jgi:hypothetical protein